MKNVLANYGILNYTFDLWGWKSPNIAQICHCGYYKFTIHAFIIPLKQQKVKQYKLSGQNENRNLKIASRSFHL